MPSLRTKHHSGGIRLVVLCIAFTTACPARELPLERAKKEAERIQHQPLPPAGIFADNIKALRTRSADFHAVIRDWVESVLPKSRASLNATFSSLGATLNADLRHAGLLAPDNQDDISDFSPGTVGGVAFSRPAEDANKLVVTVGVSLPCGYDAAVYVYDYSRGHPRRVLESHGTRDDDESVEDVRISKPDAVGDELILTLRYGVQCGSSWNELSYDLFRLPAHASAATRILSGEHGIWFAAEHPYQIRLEPDDLLMEIRDRSIDSALHNRAHILHFKVANSTVERVDPVALQPQDFVDEWLTRPWSEMESRSAENGRDNLKQWHDTLGGELVFGDFRFVQQCREPDQWQVGIDPQHFDGKDFSKGRTTYFLVQQFDTYRFRMAGISIDRQPGCPGQTEPQSGGPTLFPAIQKNQPTR